VLFETLARQGNWLFRRRGYLPLLLTPILAGAMLNYPNAATVPDGLRNILCGVIVLIGLFIRGYTTGHAPPGTSGGNTKRQIADSLNVTGFYSVVRHPLYLGNGLCWLGVALFTQSPALVALIVLVFWLYYERIMMAEEAFLLEEFGDAFRAWAARTPAFLPNPRLWVPPVSPFDWRNAARREYSGIYWMIAIFSLLQFVGDSATAGRPTFVPAWVAFFMVGTCAGLVIMYLRRKTDIIGPRRSRRSVG
jgi:protein-S-isoprenylcysteine O-methyltransferase Ste14